MMLPFSFLVLLLASGTQLHAAFSVALPVAMVWYVYALVKNQKEKTEPRLLSLVVSLRFSAVSSHIYDTLLKSHRALHAPASLGRFVTRAWPNTWK